MARSTSGVRSGQVARASTIRLLVALGGCLEGSRQPLLALLLDQHLDAALGIARADPRSARVSATPCSKAARACLEVELARPPAGPRPPRDARAPARTWAASSADELEPACLRTRMGGGAWLAMRMLPGAPHASADLAETSSCFGRRFSQLRPSRRRFSLARSSSRARSTPGTRSCELGPATRRPGARARCGAAPRPGSTHDGVAAAQHGERRERAGLCRQPPAMPGRPLSRRAHRGHQRRHRGADPLLPGSARCAAIQRSRARPVEPLPKRRLRAARRLGQRVARPRRRRRCAASRSAGESIVSVRGRGRPEPAARSSSASAGPGRAGASRGRACGAGSPVRRHDLAAAEGVGARRSATRSAMLTSTSWPTPETTGTGLRAMARATGSVLNGLEILERAAAPHQEDRRRRPRARRRAVQRRGDLALGAHALHPGRREQQRESSGQRRPVTWMHVAHGRAGGRGDDADAPRRRRQGPLVAPGRTGPRPRAGAAAARRPGCSAPSPRGSSCRTISCSSPRAS